MALTERERKILLLRAQGLNDYKIARRLSVERPNVTCSRKNALRKIDRAKADLEYIDKLVSKPSR
jgi:transcriptional regulator